MVADSHEAQIQSEEYRSRAIKLLKIAGAVVVAVFVTDLGIEMFEDNDSS